LDKQNRSDATSHNGGGLDTPPRASRQPRRPEISP
jgi:hypothetical protein